MAITKNNPHIRLILLLLAAALTAWGGPAVVPAYADTSDWIWVTGGTLRQPRLAPTATLVDLPKAGKGVLLVGGGNETNIDPINIWLKEFNTLRTCELYKPNQTGFLYWQPSLKQSRVLHTATLLPKTGKLLVVGGLSKEATPVELPFGIKIWLPGSISTCELFDPKNPDGNWTNTQHLSGDRLAHTATLLSKTGKLLVAGGIQIQLDMKEFFTKLKIKASVQTLASSELYDPDNGTWSPTAKPLKHSRALHTATLLPGGKVLVTGGIQLQRNYELDLSKYDSKDWTKWVKITESAIQTLNSSEIYDPAKNSWDNATSLTQPRFLHTATLLPKATADISKVLVAGGQSGYGGNSTIERSCEIYDSKTKTWTLKPDREGLLIPSSQHTATLLSDDRVLLVGGSVDSYASQIYDPEGDFWTLTYDFLWYPRSWHTATELPNHEILVAGGGPSNLCEKYQPPSASALMQRRISGRAKASLPGD